MSLKRGHAAYSKDGPAHWSLQPREGARSGRNTTASGSNRSLTAAKPSRVTDEDDNGVDSDTAPEQAVRARKKAEPVKSACVQCQKRKTKCSGQRPVCRFCSDRDLKCSWEITDGMTRTADLKQKLQDATGKSEDLDLLVDALRSGSDIDSTMLLARLRLGTSVEDLAKSLRLELALTDSTDSPSEGTFSSQTTNSSDRPVSDSAISASPASSIRKLSRAGLYIQQAATNERRTTRNTDYQPTSPDSFLTADFDQSRMTWKPKANGVQGLKVVPPGDFSAQRRGSEATSWTQSPTSPSPAIIHSAGA